MYILLLPVILVFHSQSHVQDVIEIVVSDYDQVNTLDNSDCQICSFYFDQQLYVENSILYQFDSSPYYFLQSIVESPVVLLQEQQRLRGPPAV